MNSADQLVVFILDERRYALPLSSVERCVRMVEVTPLPKGPEIVLGVIGVQGRIVPVLSIRKRFGLAEREPGLSDQLMIAHTAKRAVALVVDTVSGVIDHPSQEPTVPAMIVPGMEYVTGVITLEDGLLFIHDLDRFLSLEEEEALDRAISTELADAGGI